MANLPPPVEAQADSIVSDGRARSARQGLLRFLAIPTAAAAVIALIARLPYMWDMPALDAAQYLTAAQGWADGLVPYKDLFAEKGPLLYIFLLGLQEIAPRSIVGVHLGFLLVIIASASLLAAFVERHTSRRVAWWTAVIYALLASSTLWELNDVNTEQLGLPFMVAAVDLADRFWLSGRRWQATGAGAALAACFWVKPSIAFVGPLILALLLLRPDRRLVGLVASAAGALVASAAVLAPYAAAHALDAFRFSQSTYNHEYVTRGFDNLTSRSWDDQLFWIFNVPSSGVFVAGLALGAFAWVVDRHRRLVLIGGAWLILEYAGAKFGVRDFAHYFVPMLPPCALLIGVGGDAIAAQLRSLEGRPRTVLAVAALLPLATYLVLNPAIVRVGGPSDIRVRQASEIADVVDSVTTPSQRIYVAAFDEGYQVYWVSHRDPATRFYFAEVMGASPYSYDFRYLKRVRKSLKDHPPAAIVLWPNSLAALGNQYIKPAIKRGGLHRVADIAGVKIFARRQPPVTAP